MGLCLAQRHIECQTDSHPTYFGIWSKTAASLAGKVPIRTFIVPSVTAGHECKTDAEEAAWSWWYSWQTCGSNDCVSKTPSEAKLYVVLTCRAATASAGQQTLLCPHKLGNTSRRRGS